MTEQQTTETNDEQTVRQDQSTGARSLAPEPTVNTETVEQTEEEGKKGNSEAAKWRVRFREAEAEVDALKARVGDMQAGEVSRLATGPGALHDGADLLLTTQLADLLDDEGNVDEGKVTEAVAALVEKKPHLARPAFDGGVGIGEKGTAATTTWADVIAG